MATDTVQYAVLGLLAASSRGAHGYQLKGEFDSLYADFWSLNYGQLYRTLDRLERAGLILGSEEVQSGRPNRKVYRITQSGKKTLDDWLLLPPSDEPRPLRDELSVKLIFLTDLRREETLVLIRSQRATYLQHLARLTKRRARLDTQSSFATNLLLLQSDMRVRADLAWLDHVEDQVRRRFTPERPGTPPRQR